MHKPESPSSTPGTSAVVGKTNHSCYMMKKLTILSIVALFFGALAVPKAEARGYKSRVHSHCAHCRKNVYAYYRPMVYHGVTRYAWVPSYHTSCAQRASYTTRYHRGTPYNYPVQVRRSYSNYGRAPSCNTRVPYSGYNRGYGYSGYRPGISVTIRR